MILDNDKFNLANLTLKFTSVCVIKKKKKKKKINIKKKKKIQKKKKKKKRLLVPQSLKIPLQRKNAID